MLYRRTVSVDQVQALMLLMRGSQLSLSLRAWVFHPNTCRHVRLLGPCFKTGRLKPLRQHPKHVRGRTPAMKACCGPRSQPSYTTMGYNTPEGATFPKPFSNGQNRCWPIRPESTPSKSEAESWQMRLTSSVSLSAISRTV